MISKKLEEVVKVMEVSTGEVKYITASEFNRYDYIKYEKID